MAKGYKSNRIDFSKYNKKKKKNNKIIAEEDS